MKDLRRVAKTTLIVVTGLCLLFGGLLIWAGQSWYVLVWLTAKEAFPASGVRIVMVNTEATQKRKSDYGLPNEFHNIALIALIVDRHEKVVATAWREGFLDQYPKPPVEEQFPHLDVLHLKVTSWMEVFRVTGWVLALIGVIQAIAIYFLEVPDRKGAGANIGVAPFTVVAEPEGWSERRAADSLRYKPNPSDGCPRRSS